MYLHLGNQIIVRTADIDMIFDMDQATVSHITRNFLAKAAREKRVVTVTGELPKSFVLMRDGTIYISQLSSTVLRKRAEEVKFDNLLRQM